MLKDGSGLKIILNQMHKLLYRSIKVRHRKQWEKESASNCWNILSRDAVGLQIYASNYWNILSADAVGF